MSYNPYSNSNQNYSPYYQQSTGHDVRNNQYVEHARNHSAYTPSAYQPLSAYQSAQRPQVSAPQSTNSNTAYGTQGYASGAAGGSSQDLRAGYTDSRSSVDTSALGNLAYASSLGRDDSNLHQNMTYNQTSNGAGYGNPSTYGIGSAQPVQYSTGHGTQNGSTATSMEDHGARSQLSTSSPSFGYPSSAGGTGYISQQSRSSVAGQAQTQRPGSQQPRPSFQQQVNQYHNPPSRPSSGQAIQRSHSTTESQSGPPPSSAIVSATQSYQSPQHGSDITGGYLNNTRVSTPKQQSKQPPHADTNSRSGTYASNAHSKRVTNEPTLRNASKPSVIGYGSTPASSDKSPYTPSVPLSKVPPSSKADYQIDNQRSQTSTPTTTHFPTTVDPSQVFNNVEYQRRQAAAAVEAEAAKKKSKDAQIATQTRLSKPDSSQIERPSSVSQSIESDTDLAKKNQMELEMKTMIEKMRDYKSKDPSLFSQIWDQVKKGPQRASNQLAPEGSATSPVVIDGNLPSPDPAQLQLPPESELAAAEAFPLGFDRGRFPAQRRRRGNANFTPPRKLATPKKGINTTSENETMQKAMEQFHRESISKSPMASASAPVAQMVDKRPSPSPLPQPTPSSATAPANARPPDPPKPGGTYWPEDKKRQLAEAARAALLSTKPNAGKDITADELHKLLDQNPSYTQMCEILESRGFVIDRGQFARLLLSAVPDLGSTASRAPSKPPPSALPMRPQSSGLTTPLNAPPGQPPVAPPSSKSSVNQATRPPPNGIPAPANLPPPYPANSRTPAPPPYPAVSQAPTPHGMPYSAPQAPLDSRYKTSYAPRNPSKDHVAFDYSQWNTNQRQQHEGMMKFRSKPVGEPLNANQRAMNRPFMSGVKWGANAIPYHPPATSQRPTKQDMARKRSFGEIVDLTQELSDNENADPASKRSRTDVNPESDANTNTPGNYGKSLDNFRYKPSGREHLHSQEVVRTMDKRKDALRRSSYNPKTIATDVLVALGKHPSVAALNTHLDILRERFTAVNHDSDLSSFRWDLVDPGGPPLPSHTKSDKGKDMPAVKRPDQRAHVAVVINGGPSNGNAIPSNPTLKEGHSRTSKPTRGGHITSSGPSRTSKTMSSASQPQTPQQGSESHFSRFVNHELPVMLNSITGANGEPDALKGYNIARNAYLSQKSSPAVVSPLSQSTTPGTASGQKRVGRPPGAKNKAPRPDKGIPKKDRDAPTQDIPMKFEETQTPNSRRPRVDTTPARLSGLRNAISPTDGIAVIIPSRSPSILDVSRVSSDRSAKMGGLRKASEVTVRPPSTPSYTIYKCQWDNCPAELHNLETLKKHVRKHRGQKTSNDGHLLCLWANCHSSNATVPPIPDVKASSQNGHSTFESETAWDQHVEDKHINTLARELGDVAALPSSESNSNDEFQTPKKTPKGKDPARVVSNASTPTRAKPMVVLPG